MGGLGEGGAGGRGSAALPPERAALGASLEGGRGLSQPLFGRPCGRHRAAGAAVGARAPPPSLHRTVVVVPRRASRDSGARRRPSGRATPRGRRLHERPLRRPGVGGGRGRGRMRGGGGGAGRAACAWSLPATLASARTGTRPGPDPEPGAAWWRWVWGCGVGAFCAGGRVGRPACCYSRAHPPRPPARARAGRRSQGCNTSEECAKMRAPAPARSLAHPAASLPSATSRASRARGARTCTWWVP